MYDVSLENTLIMNILFCLQLLLWTIAETSCWKILELIGNDAHAAARARMEVRAKGFGVAVATRQLSPENRKGVLSMRRWSARVREGRRIPAWIRVGISRESAGHVRELLGRVMRHGGTALAFDWRLRTFSPIQLDRLGRITSIMFLKISRRWSRATSCSFHNRTRLNWKFDILILNRRKIGPIVRP